MRASFFLGFLLLGPCDKDATSSTADANAPATATATTTVATPSATAAATGTVATGATGGTGATTGAKPVATTISGNGKTVSLDGGNLAMMNDAGMGTVTQTDAGVVLKGKDGKTLTLPPVPGLK